MTYVYLIVALDLLTSNIFYPCVFFNFEEAVRYCEDNMNSQPKRYVGMGYKRVLVGKYEKSAKATKKSRR